MSGPPSKRKRLLAKSRRAGGRRQDADTPALDAGDAGSGSGSGSAPVGSQIYTDDDMLDPMDPACHPEMDMPPPIMTAGFTVSIPVSAESSDEQLKEIKEITIKQGGAMIKDKVTGFARLPCVTDECWMKGRSGMEVIPRTHARRQADCRCSLIRLILSTVFGDSQVTFFTTNIGKVIIQNTRN